MLKKIFAIALFITCNANADFVQLNKEQLSEQDDTEKSIPHFQSIAEEAAYNKRLQAKENAEIQHTKDEFLLTYTAQVKKYMVDEKEFAEKYFVKNNDLPVTIDSKFKNRLTLSKKMLEDYLSISQERADFHDQYVSKYHFNFQPELESYVSKKLSTLVPNSERYLFSNLPQTLSLEGYVDRCEFKDQESYFTTQESITDLYHIASDLISNEKNIKNAHDREEQENLLVYEKDLQQQFEKKYEAYLKCSYYSYEDRQLQIEKKKQLALQYAQAEKEHQAKIDQERREREKVQGACQLWKVKANRSVYSLGVGDKIVSRYGGVYIIKGSYSNTFLVNALGYNLYLQKSECIPYSSLKNAPSPYCYR